MPLKQGRAVAGPGVTDWIAMEFFVGVTNNSWYSFLAEQRPAELNFWIPSGRTFKALRPGEMFLFKPHYRREYPYSRHCVAGGGIFTGFTRMTVAESWEAFGKGNGTYDVGTLCRMLKLPPNAPAAALNTTIGCVVLVEPFFFEPDDWITIPDWSPNIVQGKGYDTAERNGKRLWDAVRRRLGPKPGTVIPVVRDTLAHYQATPSQSRYGSEILIRARLGQTSFRMTMMNVYRHRCAISGETAQPALEAAHIRPFAKEGPHMVQNGLVLRSDLHCLFDKRYMTITPEYIVLVSSRLEKLYGTSSSYSEFHGRRLSVLPRSTSEYPDAEFLEWHNRNAFDP
jgi:putative restriction endonuclease